jgi:hypothetical protein
MAAGKLFAFNEVSELIKRPKSVVWAVVLCLLVAAAELAIASSIIWAEARSLEEKMSVSSLVSELAESQIGYSLAWLLLAIGLFFRFNLIRWSLVGWTLFIYLLLPISIIGWAYTDDVVIVDSATVTGLIADWFRYISIPFVLAVAAIALSFSKSAKAFYSARTAESGAN